MKINISFNEFKKQHSQKKIKFYLHQVLVRIMKKLKIYLNFYLLKKIVLYLSQLKKVK